MSFHYIILSKNAIEGKQNKNKRTKKLWETDHAQLKQLVRDMACSIFFSSNISVKDFLFY